MDSPQANPRAATLAKSLVTDPPSDPLVELVEAAIAAAENPDQLVVEPFNWTIAPGDFWAVGGLPGTGKSLLLETAAGLRRPAQGSLRLFGEDIRQMTVPELLRARQRIGFVFGDGGRPLQHLTVTENVGLPLCYRQECAAEQVAGQVDALLASLGVKTFANFFPTRLNQAMAQRAALARALILGPDILFLNNPSAGLDVRQARWWPEFLGQLAAGHECRGGRPLALVVANDDFGPWLGVARQFAILREGRWLPLGGRQELEASTDPGLRDLLVEPPAVR